jgi:hypothetical protein
MPTWLTTLTATCTIAILSTCDASVRASAGGLGEPGASACTTRAQMRLNHVRSLDPVLDNALENGLSRSPLFRRLVQRIELLNGIVYLSAGAVIRRGPPGYGLGRISGATSLEVVPAGDYRILKANVELRSSNRTVATLGHELQHVVEILEAPDARDLPSVERLFARIGYLVSAGTYETTAAQEAGDRVFKELSRCPAPLPPSSSEPILRIVTR